MEWAKDSMLSALLKETCCKNQRIRIVSMTDVPHRPFWQPLAIGQSTANLANYRTGLVK